MLAPHYSDAANLSWSIPYWHIACSLQNCCWCSSEDYCGKLRNRALHFVGVAGWKINFFTEISELAVYKTIKFYWADWRLGGALLTDSRLVKVLVFMEQWDRTWTSLSKLQHEHGQLWASFLALLAAWFFKSRHFLGGTAQQRPVLITAIWGGVAPRHAGRFGT